MGDIPGFLASEFPDDARHVPGQEAFTARKQAEEEEEQAADGTADPVDEKQIFYKQDESHLEDEASDTESTGRNADESTYGEADL
ncbi:hypothetical protein B7R54_02890 [Subtercola boreus]|uniref:Uncharacterized protein n=1 Tax=Subtercola boreus TaxID=120213 RepID=A0A3E0VED4_9MICO|nr:hypothetical protein [Subtercola boreus]RFA08286.1 hypothetical protein B7R54_02890 [Subtercola boreus]TQL54816.1 hypothetical protein FB464_2362 [Subtercola boreus]